MVRVKLTISIGAPPIPINEGPYHSIWYCQGSGPKVSNRNAGSSAIKDKDLNWVSKRTTWIGELEPEGGWAFLNIMLLGKPGVFPQYHVWGPLFHAGHTQNTVTRQVTVMETDTHLTRSTVFLMGLSSRRGINFCKSMLPILQIQDVLSPVKKGPRQFSKVDPLA
jgi:hypothetical protein